MQAPNHYEVLGLPVTATQDEILRRYEELARLYSADGPQSEMFRLIAEARRVLSNPVLRSVYDSGLGGASAPAPVAQAFSTPVSAPLSPVPPVSPAVPPVPSVSFSAPQSVGPDVTQEVPRATVLNRAVDDRTIEVPPEALPSQNAPSGEAPAGPDNKKIAEELSRRGISPSEVQRLLTLGTPAAAPKNKRGVAIVEAPAIPPSVAYVPKPTIKLPEFRESSVQERTEADRLLTGANISRRRNQFADAERQVREALQLIPKDASALELYGDILQGVGRVDDALYAYERASQADPKRRTAEKKYAELMLLQNREFELLRHEGIPRSPFVAVLLSSVFPGAGQIYNGEWTKGLGIVLAALLCGFAIFSSPYGLPHSRAGIPTSLVVLIVIAGLIYIYSVVDAKAGARRGKAGASGWEV